MNSLEYPSQRPIAATRRLGTALPPDPDPEAPFTTYFQQSCPTCGRKLVIQVEYLGQRVYCTHCRSAFLACDVPHQRGVAAHGAGVLLERAERLLALFESSCSHRQAYHA